MRRILITGSNRGIGLALVKQYLSHDDTLIFATCRDPDSAATLQVIAEENASRVHIIQLDVADNVSIERAAQVVHARVDGLDMLINNAGILPGGVENRAPEISVFGELDAEALLRLFRVNTIAPIMVTQGFADLLRNGNNARVINVSSNAGSIARRDHGCDYGYPSSKAGLNMMSRCLAGDLRQDNIIVVSLHPGFIKTDMGGANAHLTLDDAVPTMVATMDSLTMSDSGLFWNWDGKPLDW